MSKRIDFQKVLEPGQHPHYVHRGGDADVELYYAEPPMAPRGIYVLIHVAGSDKVTRSLFRQVDTFDEKQLDHIASNFYLDVKKEP